MDRFFDKMSWHVSDKECDFPSLTTRPTENAFSSSAMPNPKKQEKGGEKVAFERHGREPTKKGVVWISSARTDLISCSAEGWRVLCFPQAKIINSHHFQSG